jgi:HEAT repeat protein
MTVVVSTMSLATLAGCPGPGNNNIDPMAKEIRAPKAPPPAPKQINEPINEELRVRAKAVIDESLASNDPIIRANALEAIQNTIGKQGAESIKQGLNDPEAVVRFAAAMAAGTVQIPQTRDTLWEMANADNDGSVRVAARYGLHRLGDKRLSHDLEKTAIDVNKAVRANTAMVLGRLGEPSALNVLRAMMNDRERLVRIQVFEAMWRLGDEKALENLIASSMSGAPDDQIIATIAMAEPKDGRVAGPVYSNLTSDYEETRLAAARAMGMLGHDDGYAIAQSGSRSPDPRIKVMSALALGAIGRSDAQPSLTRLLGDQNPNVKLAAATAILQLKPPKGE